MSGTSATCTRSTSVNSTTHAAQMAQYQYSWASMYRKVVSIMWPTAAVA